MFRFFPALLRRGTGDSRHIGFSGLKLSEQQVILDARKHFFSGVHTFCILIRSFNIALTCSCL